MLSTLWHLTNCTLYFFALNLTSLDFGKPKFWFAIILVEQKLIMGVLHSARLDPILRPMISRALFPAPALSPRRKFARAGREREHCTGRKTRKKSPRGSSWSLGPPRLARRSAHHSMLIHIRKLLHSIILYICACIYTYLKHRYGRVQIHALDLVLT